MTRTYIIAPGQQPTPEQIAMLQNASRLPAPRHNNMPSLTEEELSEFRHITTAEMFSRPKRSFPQRLRTWVSYRMKAFLRKANSKAMKQIL